MSDYNVTLIIHCNMIGNYFFAGNVNHEIVHGTINESTPKNIGDTTVFVNMISDADGRPSLSCKSVCCFLSPSVSDWTADLHLTESKGCEGSFRFRAWDPHSSHHFKVTYVCNNQLNHSVVVTPDNEGAYEITINPTADAMKSLKPFCM